MKALYVPEWEITAAMIPKCGSSSVRNLVCEHFGVSNHRLGKITHPHVYMHFPEQIKGRTITAVRHPLDRFESLWKQKCLGTGKVKGHELNGLSPEELFDYTEAHVNWHWMPQSEILRPLRHLSDLHIVPLDELDAAWAALVPKAPKLPQDNVTRGGAPLTPYVQLAVLDKYADDIDLYEESFNWRNNL